MDTCSTMQQTGPATTETLRVAELMRQAGNLEGAVKAYLSILQAAPDHPEANHNLGWIAVQNNQPADGLPYLLAALQADPTRGPFWLSYIDALDQAGRPDEARKTLEFARQQGLQGDGMEALAIRLGVSQVKPQAAGHSNRPSRPAIRELEALVALMRTGRFAEAERAARAMTEAHPRHGLAWKTLAVALMQQGRIPDALLPMETAASLLPDDVEAHYNLGVVLQALGRLKAAEASYRQALRIDPRYADAHCNLGVTLHRLDRLHEAETCLQQARRLRPGYTEVHNNLGAVLRDLGKLEEAEACCRAALRRQPDNAGIHNNLGNVLKARGRLEEAEASYRRALAINPRHTDACNNLSQFLHESGRLDEAAASYRKTLGVNPRHADAHCGLGLVLHEQGQLEQAEASYRKALDIDPLHAHAHNNLGAILQKQNQLDQAESCYRKALAIDPCNLKALANCGKLLHERNQLREAEAYYQRLIDLKPDDVAAHVQLGRIHNDAFRHEAAAECFHRAMEIAPDNAAVHASLAATLLMLCRSEEAADSMKRSLELSSNEGTVHSNSLYQSLLDAGTDARLAFIRHVQFAEHHEAPLRETWPLHANPRDPDRNLQIGFVSADFYNHAVTNFIEPVVEHLAANPRLMLHAYYNGRINDKQTERLRQHFAHWHAVADVSAEGLAERIREDEIDILIDLSGHTAGNRLLTFARKPAPVQASWIGYPGTTGLTAMDYYLADRFLLPPGRFDDLFTEKIARLPANAPFRPFENAPPVNALPALHVGHITFGSFNRPNKLSREIVALWSRLLHAIPDSRMLLGAMPTDGVPDALVDWFAEEGITRERLEFHPRSTLNDYLALHHRVDICLDTFPYNGGTTTQHALWMGVPTLTLAGHGMPGRVGLAILSRVGLEEFAVETADDFIARGVHWSNNLSLLGDLRRGLRERIARAPLRQPEIIATGLERALRIMWKRWCASLPAESFEVDASDLIDAKGGDNHG